LALIFASFLRLQLFSGASLAITMHSMQRSRTRSKLDSHLLLHTRHGGNEQHMEMSQRHLERKSLRSSPHTSIANKRCC
jgi:hypothetical protein